MAPRHLSPDHPRAIFAGDAARDLERTRAQQQPAPDITALRARTSRMTPPPGERREAADPGEIIADIPRTDGTLLRIAVKRWRNPDAPAGAPPAVYVDLRVWSGAWPVKGKGLTVKPRELAAVASALLDAAEKLSAERGSR